MSVISPEKVSVGSLKYLLLIIVGSIEFFNVHGNGLGDLVGLEYQRKEE